MAEAAANTELKIGIVGMRNTGKTSLIECLKHKYPINLVHQTEGLCVSSIVINTSIGPINIKYWDIHNTGEAHNDKWFFYDMEHVFIGANAMILTYDIGNTQTYNDLGILSKILSHTLEEKKIFIVGCKSDIHTNIIKSDEIDEQFGANPLYLGNYETTNTDPDGVCEVFESIMMKILGNMNIQLAN